MKVVKSEKHRLHFPRGELYGGEMVRPFECPERWDYVLDELKDRGYDQHFEPDSFDVNLVQSIHTPAFVEFLETAWDEWATEGMKGDAIPTVIPTRRMQSERVPKFIEGKLGFYCMAIETAITSGTWEAAKSAVACATTAQKMVAPSVPAFALCRPPGHHAGKDLYGGYCFMNNASLAVEGFLRDGAKRVALLDVDFHHGNGSQDIFYDRDDVLFCSLHGHPEDAFPHFLGYSDECGTGAGEGFNRNYPMRPNTQFSVWNEALDDACRHIQKFSPDAIVVSLGVDTYKDDPISFFKLDSDDFTRYGETIGRLNVPTLFIMEGGYAVSEIGLNAVNVLDGFLSA